jgi:hypothetical protein
VRSSSLTIAIGEQLECSGFDVTIESEINLQEYDEHEEYKVERQVCKPTINGKPLTIVSQEMKRRRREAQLKLPDPVSALNPINAVGA